MSKDKVFWTADGKNLPNIEPHSKAKHKILEDYIKNWIVTLCGNNMGKRKTVTLIDGFCGGGMYRDPENNDLWEGSPIRMIRMVEKGLESVRNEKSKPNYDLNVKFIFIDHKKPHLDCLKLQMRHLGLENYIEDSDLCTFICSEFEVVVDQIISEIKKRKGSSIFFLDPFGYTDTSMASIRKIMNLGKSEIIYTFMIDFLRRFMSEKEEGLSNAFHNILEADGYYNKARLDHANTVSHQEYLRNETLRLFRNKTNAQYVYTFALLTNSTLVKYYLIHLSNNPTALKVLKNSLWEHNNIDLKYQFSYGVYGLGFRTPDYYDRNKKIFDIEEINSIASIESLNDDLMPIIYNNKDGTEFDDLHNQTMQTNPATIDHYMSYIDEQRSVGEIEVWRNGKITKAKKLKPGDIIIKSRQGKFFDMKIFLKK